MASSKGSRKTSKKRAKKQKKAKAAKKRATAQKRAKAAVPKSLRKGALPTSVGEVMAAGLGALRHAQSSAGTPFSTLVKRGRAVQAAGSDAAQEAAREVDEAVDRALQTVRAAGEAVTEGVQNRVESVVEGVLLRLGVPTRAEVRELQVTVDALTLQLDGVTAASSMETPRATFEVRKDEKGWAVRRDGESEPTAIRSTKKQALFEARAMARKQAPSELTVYKLDGSIGDTTTYGD